MADYRRKKRNLNKVDFSNKTKNQSKRYLINQFESLGIKVPNYVNNPTTGNINKALKGEIKAAGGYLWSINK